MPWLLRMLLSVSLPILAAYIYVGWRVHQAFGALGVFQSQRRSQLIILVVVLVNLYPAVVLVSYFGGSRLWAVAIQGGNRWIDLAMTYPFWIGVLVVAQLVPLLLVIDFVRFGVSLTSVNPPALESFFAKLAILATAVVCFYTAGRTYVDTRHVRMRERVVTSSKLAPGAPEVRIVHISDVQVDPRTDTSMVNRLVLRISEADPDIVAFSGDLVTSGTTYIEQAASSLGKIQARCGVYACMGDHDYWADPERVTQSLSKHGIDMMEDESRMVTVGSTQVRVTGVTNIYSRRPPTGRLSQVAGSRDSQRLSVFITHQPSETLVEFARKSGYDLFLSGHTHGGQIILGYPPVGFTPAMLETEYVSGFYQAGDMLVSICNGLGLTFAPLRYHAPAEFTLLRVRPADPAGPPQP